METTTETTTTIPKEESDKFIVNSLTWVKDELSKLPILAEEFQFLEDFINVTDLMVDKIKTNKDSQIYVPFSLEGKTEDEIKHEFNKYARQSFAWAHYKIQVTPFPKGLHKLAREATGVLASICMDYQKKIEAVEPPAPPKQMDNKKTPYIMEVPTAVEQ